MLKDYPVISFGENPVTSSEDATSATVNIITMSTNNVHSYVGLARLVQLVVKQMLNTIDTHTFLPSMGGNFTKYLGMALEDQQFDAVLGELVSNIKDIGEHIKAQQEGTTDLEDSERLDSIDIIDYHIDHSENKIIMKIRLVTEAGLEAEAVLAL